MGEITRRIIGGSNAPRDMGKLIFDPIGLEEPL
jgi:hypothetical protein